jgi:single-stranded-DNA-specific exonuclease
MGTETRQGDGPRSLVRGAGSITVTIAELVSSGAGVLAVCADASRRAALAAGATGLARFNGGAGRVACGRCGDVALDAVLARANGGLGLVDYAVLERSPDVARRFEHVVLVDPPPSAAVERLAARPCAGAGENGDAGPVGADAAAGFLHVAWTEAEREFALAVCDERHASRAAVAVVFRSLREAGEVGGSELRAALGGGGTQALAPEAAARCFRVLAELGLIAGEPNGGAGNVGVVSSEGTDLERSAAFRAYRAKYSEAQRFLERPKEH